jgi:hypothetical protein
VLAGGLEVRPQDAGCGGHARDGIGDVGFRHALRNSAL